MEDRTNKNISEILNVNLESEIIPAKKVENNIIKSNEKEDSEQDYELVRKNLENIIFNSKIAMDKLMDISDATEAPRAFEVLSDLIKTNLEANDRLIDLHRKMKILNKEKTEQTKNITNNSIYVGSTSELLSMIKKNKKTE